MAPVATRAEEYGVARVAEFAGQVSVMGAAGAKVYTTCTAPLDTATPPEITMEQTLTMNGEAKAAAETPPIALAPPLGDWLEDDPTLTDNLTVASHMTAGGPPG